MVIGAECNQVAKVICPAVSEGCYMVDMDMNVEATNSTAVIIAQHDLILNEFYFTALPVAIKMAYFGVAGCQAMPIAIISFFYLAGEFFQLSPAVGTCNGDLINAPRFGGHPLPFDVALALRASNLIFRRPFVERVPANRTRGLFFPAAIIAIMYTAMLMPIDVFILPAGVLFPRDDLPTATSAKYRFSCFNSSVHKTIIHG